MFQKLVNKSSEVAKKIACIFSKFLKIKPLKNFLMGRLIRLQEKSIDSESKFKILQALRGNELEDDDKVRHTLLPAKEDMLKKRCFSGELHKLVSYPGM